MNADPAARAKAAATIAAWTPAQREAKVAPLRAHREAMPADERERRREHGRMLAREYLSRPDVIAKRLAPECRAKWGATKTERMLAHIPPERRDEYRNLLGRKFTAEQASAIILAEIPGTEQHTLRMIANRLDARAIVAERERRDAY